MVTAVQQQKNISVTSNNKFFLGWCTCNLYSECVSLLLSCVHVLSPSDTTTVHFCWHGVSDQPESQEVTFM